MVIVVVSIDVVFLTVITIDRWRFRLERILLIRSVSPIVGCLMNSEDMLLMVTPLYQAPPTLRRCFQSTLHNVCLLALHMCLYSVHVHTHVHT